MTITPDANSVLLEYRWPGNISEFKNRMEKVFINCNRLVLGLENIPLDIRQNNSSGDDDILILLHWQNWRCKLLSIHVVSANGI